MGGRRGEMTYIEKLDLIVKSKIPCPVCKGSGEYDLKDMKNVSVYGMSLETIMNMWTFAKTKGWRND